MRQYTALWNVCIKNSCVAEQTECNNQQFKTIAQTYSPSDVSIIFVKWWEHIYSGHTKKPAQWLIVRSSVNQEERCRRVATKCRHTQLMFSCWWVVTSVGESEVVDIVRVWYLSVKESRLVRSITCHMMLLQEFLPIIRHIWSVGQACSSFSRTVSWHTGHLRDHFFATPVPNVELFQKFFLKIQQWICHKVLVKCTTLPKSRCYTTFWCVINHNTCFRLFLFSDINISMLWHCWFGQQEGHPACKNWVMSYWRGYLSGVRCKWFAYGPADATATLSSLAPVKSRMVYLSGGGLQVVLEKRPLNGCSSSSSFVINISQGSKDVNESRNARVSKKILVLENLISRRARNSRTHKAKLHD